MAGCKKLRGKNKPKVKTNKSTMKRFSVTRWGLIKHAAKGRRHCLSNKNRKRKRKLGKTKYLTGGDVFLVRRQMPCL